MIRFERFYAQNDLRNFSYLIYDDKSGSAWVIDPYEAKPFTEYIKKEGLSLKGILNTHGHFDHIRGNAELVRVFDAPVKKLQAGETVELDESSSLEVIASPGHTMDHQVFLWKNLVAPPILFSGDTLFNAGVGNCKGGGDVDLLFETVESLSAMLPLDTVLQPGHDYLRRNLEFALTVDPDNKTVRERLRDIDEDPLKRAPLTLAEERETNPFLRLDSEEIRQRFEDSGRSLFIKLRALRDNW
jgi:hydroxyacylglutathione hydrolase